MSRRRSSVDKMREDVRNRRANRRPEPETRMPPMSKQNQIKAFVFALIALMIGIAALWYQGRSRVPVPNYGAPAAVSPTPTKESAPQQAGAVRSASV